MSELQIRLVRATELDRLVQLCAEHAKHEGISFDATVKSSALAELFFSDDPRICCLVVEADQQLVGYASYAIQYSTWQAAQYLYRDCLYLTPKFRGLVWGKS
jgi:L-amino acid N-acyltransferase YncA